MPIKLACPCGQGFVAKERLAGKTLKCPKCGTRLKIPQPKPAGGPQPSGQPTAAAQPTQAKQRPQPAAKPKQPAAHPKQAASKPKQAASKPKQVASKPKQPAPKPTAVPAAPAPLDDPMADLLAEAGLDGVPAPGQTCPSCGAAMSPGAVLCVACGYNQQSGRQLQTQRELDDAAEGAALSPGRPAGKGAAKGAMNVVAVGLALLYWALLLIFGSLLLAAVCGIGSLVAKSPLLALGMLVVFPAISVAVLMSIVGWLLCLAVPKQTGAKGLIIASVVLALAAILSPFFIAPAIEAELQGSLDSPIGNQGPSGSPIAKQGSLDPPIAKLVGGLVTNVLSLAAQISFLLFLKQLADYVRRSDLAEKAQLVIQFTLALVFLPFILIPLGWLPLIVAGLLSLAILLGVLVLAVCVVLQYLRLLRDLRKEILRPSRR